MSSVTSPDSAPNRVRLAESAVSAEPEPISAHAARELILRGQAPAGLTVTGHLDFTGGWGLSALPDGLCVTRLTLRGCTGLRELPAGLRCYELDLRETAITELPADLRVAYRLDLSDCVALVALPNGLTVGSLILRGCVTLAALPERLDVSFLDISGCVHLTRWPERGAISVGRLNARGCVQLRELPPWLGQLAQLDVSGCVNLAMLPETLQVTSWIDLANTPISALPPASRGAQIRWRGIAVSERVAFHPETITAQEVLAEPNAELRRVLMERMGYEAFLAEARAETLDQDTDPGGERRLLNVPLPNDEALACLAVSCPSTGRRYIIRVPPTMRSCHQAAAWIAGFDNPDDYHPLAET